jgi:hypothetical protein
MSRALASKSDNDKVALLETLCTNDGGNNTKMCVDILNADHGSVAKLLLKNTASSLDICTKIGKCGVDMDGDSGLKFHSAGLDVDGTESKDKEGAVEEADLLETGVGQEGENSSQGGSPGGLAWDKHDFDVTNNKGGDVKVEVNLAAPMTGGDGSYEDDGEDITDLLKMLAPEDPVNPLDMMQMMKELMATMRPQAPAVNMSEIVNELKEAVEPPPQQDISGLIQAMTDAVKQIKQQQPVYPPAAPGPNPETIINALQPPPPAPVPPQNPFDVGSFMRELREALAANKPPPTPPPGTDPALLDMLRETLGELKDMQKQMNQQQQAPPPPPPPPPQQDSTTVVGGTDGANGAAGATHMPPPMPPSAVPDIPTSDSIKDMIQAALNQIKPPTLPALPNFDDDSQMDELRALLKAQQQASQKPIILPPPVVPGSTSFDNLGSLPPPPPPSSDTSMEDKLKSMVSGMIPKPQRIPAPPTITVKHEHASCCPAPAPEDGRPDTERCPKINGVVRPRCKRDAPPQISQTIKCKKGPCPRADADGDIDVDGAWPGKMPESTMPSESFNPVKLLRALCPGGQCPGQGTLEPTLNKGAMKKTQTGSM